MKNKDVELLNKRPHQLFYKLDAIFCFGYNDKMEEIKCEKNK